MKPLCIERSAAVMPRHSYALEQDHEILGLSAFNARIYRSVFGLQQVPVTGPNEIDELFDKVLSQILDHSCLADIRVVIHAHTGPTVGLPGNLALQNALRRAGLTDILVLGVCSNRCVSFFNALELAHLYLMQEPDTARALIISGESACTQELRLVPNVAIVGDGVGAMLLNLGGPGDRVLSTTIHNNGEFARGVWMEYSQAKSYETRYRDLMSDVVQDALDMAGADITDITWLLPHNTNTKTWRFWAQTVGFPANRLFLDNIPRTAHCFGTDLIYNHASMRRQKPPECGNLYLMAAAGLGGMFGAAVVQCGPGTTPNHKGTEEIHVA